LEISSADLDYVRVHVWAEEDGATVNPTSDTVQMAFITPGTTPVAGDWKAASWDVDASVVPTRYRPQCLVGPGGTVTLAAGRYETWVKVTHSPEIPVKKAGLLVVV
jgi:hypothetical protein